MKLLGEREKPLPVEDTGGGKKRRHARHGSRLTGSPPPRRTKIPASDEAQDALLGGAREPHRGASCTRPGTRRARGTGWYEIGDDASVPLDRDLLQAGAVEQLSKTALQLGGGDGFHELDYMLFWTK